MIFWLCCGLHRRVIRSQGWLKKKKREVNHNAQDGNTLGTRDPGKNSTVVPGDGARERFSGCREGFSRLEHPRQHAQPLSLHFSLLSMGRFLMHSIVGDHVLCHHQDEQQPIQCELHLRVANCRLDCVIASFAQTCPRVILEVLYV